MQPRLFVVEFLEEVFSAWFFHELVQMQRYLRGKPARLVVSNFAAARAATDAESARNVRLWEEFAAAEEGAPAELPRRLAEYIDAERAELRVLGQTVALDRVCLLELKAAETLAPGDADRFQLYLFGGILGDHPPRGRTDVLLPHFAHRRNLRDRQLSTDTAVLVTSIIVNDRRAMDEIPFLDEPELADPRDPAAAVAMTGFSYVSDRYDVRAGRAGPAGGAEAPLMSPAVRELLFLDFDLQCME